MCEGIDVVEEQGAGGIGKLVDELRRIGDGDDC